MRLQFIGFQEDGQGNKFQLWNIFHSPRPDIHPDGSTISLEGLKETLDITTFRGYKKSGGY